MCFFFCMILVNFGEEESRVILCDNGLDNPIFFCVYWSNIWYISLGVPRYIHRSKIRRISFGPKKQLQTGILAEIQAATVLG